MLFKPVNPQRITQRFGANKVCVDLATGGKYISCNGLKPPKGYKSVYSKMKGHNGLDFKTYSGQPINCPQDGWVVEEVTDNNRGFGLGIVTKRKFLCKETGEMEYFKIRFWHNKLHFVHKGDEVFIGQLIALSDNTGISTGNHLHFELKPVKVRFRKSKPVGYENILQNNGYYGAINPEPYLNTMFAYKFNRVRTLTERLFFIIKLIVNNRNV